MTHEYIKQAGTATAKREISTPSAQTTVVDDASAVVTPSSEDDRDRSGIPLPAGVSRDDMDRNEDDFNFIGEGVFHSGLEPSASQQHGCCDDELYAQSALMIGSASFLEPFRHCPSRDMTCESETKHGSAAGDTVDKGTSISSDGSAVHSAIMEGANTPRSFAPVCSGDFVNTKPEDRYAATTGAPQPRSFLRKGTRMPRSHLPRHNSREPVTKPVVNARARSNPLRLQPRANLESRATLEDIPNLQGGIVARGFREMQEQPQEMASTQTPSRGSITLSEVSVLSRRQPGTAGSCSMSTIDDEWVDAVPWDRRGSDLNMEVAARKSHSPPQALIGEAPMSSVVASYFHSMAPDSSKAKVGVQPPCRGTSAPVVVDVGPLEHEAKQRIATLDQQIKRYETEVEKLRKLSAQAEQTERDLQREREKLRREVEVEKHGLRAECDSERVALKRERRRLSEIAEKQRKQVAEDREAGEERRQLRERIEQLEEEATDKDKKWQRTVDRLQRQIGDLSRKNAELHEEVRRASERPGQPAFSSGTCAVNTDCAPAMSAGTSMGSECRRSSSASLGLSRRATSAGPVGAPQRSSKSPSFHQLACGSHAGDAACGSALGVGISPPGSLKSQLWGSVPSCAPQARSAEALSTPSSIAMAGSAGGKSGADSATPSHDRGGRDSKLPEGEEVERVRHSDTHIERVFKSGRREVEFANGLKKVIWPDGRTSVFFQNGDRKEIHTDGVVVYHYLATGAVQTTLPDGEELYHFADGQFERHSVDGSREIRFPNGTTKLIFPDGSEDVQFADGSKRSTTAPCGHGEGRASREG